ncbi:MAG: hypothetical protein H7Y05_02795 [Steroidobacteraceae bacterium]|nr:hypothetical protein [Deltaproteobacteria bacterium]
MCAEINPALLTGIFALSGVALSQATTATLSFLDKSHKRKVLLREKYEELSSCFLASFEMPQKLMIYQGSTEAIHPLTHQVYGNKMNMLALLYFPQLQEIIGHYIESYSSLCLVSFSFYDSNDNRPLGTQINQNQDYIKVSNEHISARDRLQDEIQRHSAMYTNV